MKLSARIFITFSVLITFNLSADNHFKTELLIDGLGTPWGMAFLDNRQLIFTERSGRAGILDVKTRKLTRLTGLPEVRAKGQGGLLDVAVPPGYSEGEWIYFTYSAPVDSRAATALARARIFQSRLIDWQDLIVTQSADSGGRHFGSRIAFDDQGHVYFSVGDRGERSNGQDLQTHASTILRLKLDGSVPQDNPFIGRSDALPEIWSFGHRNPQGLWWDQETRQLWSIEHGPRGGDEINLIQKGKNYGWPVVSHGKEYWGPVAVGEGTHKEGMQPSVKVYIPSIAPGSLIMYRGKAFPDWDGSLMSGALKLRHINIVELNGQFQAVDETRILEEQGERIRALTLDDEGLIYYSTDSGKILVIKPENH